jgi:meso-butanediol dehydrogenase/(S,S)-butanediol dehydrogenase/diacetyl reductase
MRDGIGCNSDRQIAVVTGSGSGIGRAIALELAAGGAHVVVVDIDGGAALETVRAIITAGSLASLCEADVANPASVKALAQHVKETHGDATTLVNNAAIQVNATVENTSYEDWRREVDINFGGVFLCSKYFLPQLRATGGSIVNVSSVNGFFAERACAVYCATKAAIIGLTKAMAIDHGREGVRVNCICPGYIDTGLAAGYFQAQSNPAAARKAAGGFHALGRIGEAEEVARTARFLASADASFITGAQLVVDGGLSSGLPGSSV